MNIIALLAGLFSGIIGSMGMGGGAVLIIYLTLFTETEQLKAQGINLLFFIPIALASLIIYSKKGNIKWKTALFIAAFGLVGTAFGLWLTTLFDAKFIKYAFGVFLIVLGLKELFSKSKKNSIEK